MTTTRALAVAAYVAAVASPVAADWRAVADLLHSALPAVRGSAAKVKPTDAPGSTPVWFADWKIGKVFSLDSVAVTFADGVTIRCNLLKAPGKLPRIAAACRTAVAFYRASTGNDTVPPFISIVTASDGAEFDAEACSRLTADLRRTGIVPRAVRPAVTAEAVAKMERELERRRAGLATALDLPARIAAFHVPLCLSWDGRARAEAELRGMKESAGMVDSWREAVAAAESELAGMRAVFEAEPAAPAVAVPVDVAPMAEPAPWAAEAPRAEPMTAEPCPPVAEPAAAVPEPVAAPVEAEPVAAVPAEPAGPAPASPSPVGAAVTREEPAPAGNDDGPVPPQPGAPAPTAGAVMVDAAPADPAEGIGMADPAEGMDSSHPVVGIPDAHPVEAIGAACDHLEPMAICPALGMPCKLDCGFRPGCDGTTATGSEVEADLTTDAEPLAALCSDDDVPSILTKTASDYARGDAFAPVTVLCLSHRARAAVLSRTDGRAMPEAGHGAKGGAFRLSLADAAACAGIKSVRFTGLPRKPYTRAVAAPRTPVVGIQGGTPVRGILADVAPRSWVHSVIAGLARPPVVMHAASKL